MSSASVTTSKKEKVSELTEAIKAMNSSLLAYLEHLKLFKKNLLTTNDNFTQLNKVNKQWIETLKNLK